VNFDYQIKNPKGEHRIGRRFLADSMGARRETASGGETTRHQVCGDGRLIWRSLLFPPHQMIFFVKKKPS